MFRVDWIERYLSRVHPRQVLITWIPVALWFVARAVRDPEVGWARGVGLMATGVFAWTLLEYVLHRFVFHFEPNPASELQSDLSFLIHGVHHDWPHDADRLVMPAVLAIFLAFAVGLPLRALLGPHLFPGVFAGLVAGYIWYDLTHYAVHHLKQRTALGKLQRRNHLVHHFAQNEARFGVTTPFWDICFGTYPALSKTSSDYARPDAVPERAEATDA
jgi:sterol desaturase/sphingolipid hydroxylase (fatty acid hydroxylase superfamily)